MDNLPPELEALGDLLDAQPASVREIFQYALTMLLIEDHKAAVIEQHTMDAREYLTIQTLAGDTFSIAKPLVGDEMLDTLMEMARDVLQDEREGE